MEATLSAAAFPAATFSNKAKWTGRILSGLPAAFLIFDAAMKFVSRPEVAEASKQLGWPISVNPYLGVVLLACVALYVFPRSAVLGAVLLTGYLGGAVAVHLRVADPLFSRTLFPVYFGVMLWGGLFLRDARVRRLFAK
jgi:hypothetical protein